MTRTTGDEKKARTAVAVFAAALVAAGVFPPAGRADGAGPVRDGVQVYATATPNPAWSAGQVLDGRYDLTYGWLGSIEKGFPGLVLTFDAPITLRTIVLYQAAFREANANRFARPRDVKIELDGDSKPHFITLKDMEGQPQRFNFQPFKTSGLRIVIQSVYSEATVPDMAGFQEVELFEPGSEELEAAPFEDGPPLPVVDLLSPREGKSEFPKSTADPEPSPLEARKPEESEGAERVENPAFQDERDAALQFNSAFQAIEGDIVGGEAPSGLSEEEKRLLELLRELTGRLEAYFKNRPDG